MLLSQKLLYDQLIGGRDVKQLSAAAGIDEGLIRSIKSRFKDKAELSASFEKICQLATANRVDPVTALLSMVAHQIEKFQDKSLLSELHRSLDELARSRELRHERRRSSFPCAFTEFPHAFEPPYYVVVGDRRETGGKKMTPADFGVLSASPADLRFLDALGLPERYPVISDKIFVLAPMEDLQQRFANATLIIVGSPASNHAARIINRYALHRVNVVHEYYEELERLIAKAWEVGSKGEYHQAEKGLMTGRAGSADFFTAPKRVQGLDYFDYTALKDLLAERDADVRWQKRLIFTGGLIDPSYPQRVRATLAREEDRDFAIITLAQNPFRAENDSLYPAVYLAGYHLPGTCYALNPDIWDNRQTFFEKHPYGGVIRVDLKPLAGSGREFYTFYERMENFGVAWDDDSDYTTEKLLEGLITLGKSPGGGCHLTKHEADRAHSFLTGLTHGVQSPGA